MGTLAFLTQELDKKGTSIRRLRKLIFGASTEKTSQVVGTISGDTGNDVGAGNAEVEAQDKPKPKSKPKPKRKGHGKNGAADYQGAEKVKVSHGTLERGDPCPECPKGRLYPMKDPAVLVRVTGMAPLQAIVAEMQRLRCNLCGLVFTAQAPEGMDGPLFRLPDYSDQGFGELANLPRLQWVFLCSPIFCAA